MDNITDQFKEYTDYMFPALETYNQRMISFLEKQLAEKNLIKRYSDDVDEITLDTIKKNNPNVLIGCVHHLGIKGIKFFEEWEFRKNYEFSVLYEATNLNKENLIARLLLTAKEFKLEDEQPETLHPMIKDPTYIIKEDLVILKFSLTQSAIHPQTGATLKIKYPILAVFYTNDNVVEIRYGAIKGLFIDNFKQFYLKNLNYTTAWITQHLAINLDDFLLERLINEIKGNEDIELDGQDMRFADGGTARLQVGERKSDLPLLGELKKLINENEEFSEAIAVRRLLETWINSKEDEAEYTWISLCWPHHNTKNKNIIVKFQFDYFRPDCCLLYHYSGPVGMERMNDVTRYIIENRKRIEKEQSPQ